MWIPTTMKEELTMLEDITTMVRLGVWLPWLPWLLWYTEREYSSVTSCTVNWTELQRRTFRIDKGCLIGYEQVIGENMGGVEGGWILDENIKLSKIKENY